MSTLATFRDRLSPFLTLSLSLFAPVRPHVHHAVYPPSHLPLSARLPASIHPSVSLRLPLPACRSVTQPSRPSPSLSVCLSLGFCRRASLSGLQDVRLANMNGGGGETKCSSQHKAALIRSPHPPQHSLITGSWLASIRTDRQAERLTDGLAGWQGLSQADICIWLVNRLITLLAHCLIGLLTG